MEYVTAGLEPRRVFEIFEDLTRIPHGSYNTKQISDHCVRFAKDLGLFVRQDDLNNVVIKKPASAGAEDAPALILQGHLDMVAEKDPDSTHDFTKDPLALRVVGDRLTATGTTLGGDDGIAVAMILAILEDDSLPHPALECLLTTEEEVGMEGAQGVDLSDFSGRMMLNLDSENEGVFTVGCAGGLRTDLILPVEREPLTGTAVKLTVGGLVGGHSGVEIDKGRANANILMGRLLYALGQETEFALCELAGGMKDNAIPFLCEATVLIRPEDTDRLLETVRAEEVREQSIWAASEPGLSVTAQVLGTQEEMCVTMLDQEKLIFLLNQCPNGIQAMSMDVKGLVETSLNLGMLRLKGQEASVRFSLRSAKTASKQLLKEKLEYLIGFLGGEAVHAGDYPAWEYVPESRLRDVCRRVYTEQTEREPQVVTIHAGLECGLLAEKLPGLDGVSVGPDMADIHTPRESLSIPSVGRVYAFVLGVLKELAGPGPA